MNEFDFVDKIKRVKQFDSVVVGIGDDAAIIKTNNELQVLTTDTLVEHTHFSTSYFSPEQIGKKAVEINVSDIAAMGGTPTHLLIALSAPSSRNVHYLLKIYQGIQRAAQKYGIAIIGGDTTRSKQLVLTITILGKVQKRELMTMSSAKPGDRIFVTGKLGGSAAGLTWLQAKKKSSSTIVKKAILQHLEPSAQLQTALILAKTGLITSKTDISDGIASDIRKIMSGSKVGAILESGRIPIDKSAVHISSLLNKDPLSFALFGGEDFELLFTVSAKNTRKLLFIAKKHSLNVTEIGKIIREKRLLVMDAKGNKKELKKLGFDQLAKKKN